DLRLGPKGNVLVATRGHGVWTLRTDSSGGDAFERIEAIPARLTVRCLEFDDDDRMYLGTQSGLYRFDPRSERLRRFTPEDGLSGLEVYYAIRAQDGTLWFSFERGIARVDPDRLLDGAGTTPSLSIRDVRINGRSRPIPPLGTLAVTGIVAPPGPLSIEVDVSAVRFRDSSGLGFQYRLTDDDDAWSAPTETRTLSFVGLSAGRHRVEFRSILDGVGSSEHARLELKVLAPLWRRPWFVALFVGVVVVAAAAFLRWRWLQVARLQEIRLGLATDLHDEIGSGLSQVSILSELARRGIDGDPASTESSLRRIGEVSRNLVDSMAEIVWAINPQRDTPQDLVQRMRRFADDVLSSEHTRVTFETEGWSGAGPLGPRLRRDLFLMLKEAVHNVAKHAEAAHVRIRLSREGRRLRMLIEDDGRGFDPAVKTDGLGRPSIADRARRLGGRARIESTPGRGTRVEIEIPLGKGNTA
ncbi:MAG: ATP-binding protein, partial [Planctomycetota bacterium]|nr:ATP-binding protein [Planctomycetota bacterium]